MGMWPEFAQRSEAVVYVPHLWANSPGSFHQPPSQTPDSVLQLVLSFLGLVPIQHSQRGLLSLFPERLWHSSVGLENETKITRQPASQRLLPFRLWPACFPAAFWGSWRMCVWVEAGGDTDKRRPIMYIHQELRLRSCGCSSFSGWKENLQRHVLFSPEPLTKVEVFMRRCCLGIRTRDRMEAAREPRQH